MPEKCEFLEKCGFVLNFSEHPDTIWEGWVDKFCHNLEESETCERKKFRHRHGHPPADNIAPTGTEL